MLHEIQALTQPTQYHNDALARIADVRFHHEQPILHSRRSRMARWLPDHFVRDLDPHVKRDRDS
jgi:hypothetical protein